MEDYMNKKPLTAKEKEAAYSSIYYDEMSSIPGYVLKEINQGPMNPKYALDFDQKNKLFEPGYMEKEVGYCCLPDGGAYAAMHTIMPNVTGEMIDWWFAWHPLQPLRYKMWFPESHIDNRAEDTDRLRNPNLSYQERYQEMVQYPVENIGGNTQELSIHFRKPEKFGFTANLMKERGVPTIICGRVGLTKPKLEHTYMVHFIREIDGGVEMRSRFWLIKDLSTNYKFTRKIMNTTFFKRKLLKANGNLALNMALHCSAEYNNLAKFLPGLYGEYKDKF